MFDDFMSNVVKDPSGCWLWRGQRGDYGYYRGQGAHRVSWELHQRPIGNGLIILHGCNEKACVNPSHLRPGTHQENVFDVLRTRNGEEPTRHVPPSLHLRFNRRELDEIGDIAREQCMSKSAVIRSIVRAWLREQPSLEAG